MQRRRKPPQASEVSPTVSLPSALVRTQRTRRHPAGNGAGEIRRKRIAPSVKLNRTAVWELLGELGISQNELARLCGLS